MAAQNDDMFYSRLPANEIPLSELLDEAHLFYKVPDTWHVLVTDIKNSTQAIADGRHETVNLLATGSIIAVLNIAFRHQLTIPFFFGGDGASMIVPGRIVAPAIKALLAHQSNCRQNFNIDMRVGEFPVKDIYAHGHELRISKLWTSRLFSIPILLGDGLLYAEEKTKGGDYALEEKEKGDLDLSGMQCRWDRIKPPENYDEVVSLLVKACPGVEQAAAFKTVVEKLDEIYGSPEHRKPISIAMLKLKATVEKIGLEMKARFAGSRPFYLLFNLLKTLLGRLYFKTKKGKKYLQELVALSDTLVIDGKISTVIAGTAAQRVKLDEALAELERRGLIRYGLYASKESVMSCYVRNLHEEHIHFVDGAEGGYTRAAGMLKRKTLQMH